jgi:alpha-tubulin suppressor-like RCC1 family protein
VVGGFTWKQVSAGLYHTAAIKSDDTLWAWGSNAYGKLGTNNITSRSSPVSVVGGFTWKQVSVGLYHTAAIKSDDTLWAWGYNLYGTLGDNDGTISSRSSPVSVVGGFTWKSVSASEHYTSALQIINR